MNFKKDFGQEDRWKGPLRNDNPKRDVLLRTLDSLAAMSFMMVTLSRTSVEPCILVTENPHRTFDIGHWWWSPVSNIVTPGFPVLLYHGTPFTVFLRNAHQKWTLTGRTPPFRYAAYARTDLHDYMFSALIEQNRTHLSLYTSSHLCVSWLVGTVIIVCSEVIHLVLSDFTQSACCSCGRGGGHSYSNKIDLLDVFECEKAFSIAWRSLCESTSELSQWIFQWHPMTAILRIQVLTKHSAGLPTRTRTVL